MGRPRADGTRHFAGLENAAPEVLDYIHAAFRLKRMGAGPTWETLLKELKDGFGFKWNDTSLSRYYKYWRSDLFILNTADDQAREMIECYKAHPTADLESLIRQQLASVRLLAVRDLEGADPTAVIALGQRQEQIDLSKAKLALDREKKQLSDEKLKVDQERLQLEREKQAAIDRPSLFLEFWKQIIETIASGSPEGAAVLNQHFDQVMARIKAGAM